MAALALLSFLERARRRSREGCSRLGIGLLEASDLGACDKRGSKYLAVGTLRIARWGEVE